VALAADHFLLEPLRELCCSKIKNMVTAENVWPILNATCHVPKLAATCSKVILILCFIQICIKPQFL